MRDRWLDKTKGYILTTRKFQYHLGAKSLEDIKKEGLELFKLEADEMPKLSVR